MLELYDSQQAVLDRMIASPSNSALIAGEVGFGKTVVSVEFVKAKAAQIVLIIAPINTFSSEREGWKPSFRRQGVDLPFYEITSKTNGFDRLKKREPGIYFVGREFFARSGTAATPKRNKDTGELSKGRPQLYNWGTVRPDVVIYDEVHAAQNRKSASAKVLKQVKHGYRIGLSGTPAGDKFQGLWSICRWLFPNDVDVSFWRWATKWAVVEYSPFAGKVVKDELKSGEFVASLPCYVYAPSIMPDVEPTSVYLDLLPAQREQYEQAVREEIVWLEENPLIIEYPIVRRIRMKQMTLGTVQIDDEGVVTFPLDTRSAKLEAVKNYIAENPTENILFVTSSKSFAKAVAHQLGDKARAWTGDTSRDERNEIQHAFGTDVKYIVAVHKAIAEGIDGFQHHSHTLIAFDENLYNTLNIQVVGRLNRPGQQHEVKYFVLQARKTIDTGDFDALLRKARSVKGSTHVMQGSREG